MTEIRLTPLLALMKTYPHFRSPRSCQKKILRTYFHTKILRSYSNLFYRVPIEADEIQKKIDEMNRAIEEQTQQIQTLASTVPLLPVIAPALAASLPAGSADVASSLKALTSILTTPMETDIVPDLEQSTQPIPMEIDEPTAPGSSEVSSYTFIWSDSNFTFPGRIK